MTSRRSAISEEIMNRLSVIPEIKTSSFDKIRLLASDFHEWELPAVQVIDLADTAIYQNVQRRRTWNIGIEVVIGPKAEGGVDQKALWDLMEKIETTLDGIPKLALPYVIHLKILGSSTDLHLMDPYYTGRIDLTVDYYALSSC